jgi:hypothetical protein
MGIDHYTTESTESNKSFLFVSEGPKGKVLKQVRYDEVSILGLENVYNLAFGDIIEGTNDLDDSSRTDNLDRVKVLATVVRTIYSFTDTHTEAIIFITGSTPSRTRLYQMAIQKYFDEFSQDFSIEGFTEEGISNFEKNKRYFAFFITRKT